MGPLANVHVNVSSAPEPAARCIRRPPAPPMRPSASGGAAGPARPLRSDGWDASSSVTGRAVGQRLGIAQVVRAVQLADLFRTVRLLRRHRQHLVQRPHVVRRVQRHRAPRDGHLVHAAVALHAGHALAHMDVVFEVNEVRQVVHGLQWIGWPVRALSCREHTGAV
ncbi:conserved hypothetical protein [Ricinus communis]|uniref:Uncharacterized protein n=1 Tax=Ricinus communis TaxID=3988 RepID=B9THW5_RICCO|nr:conserved hypothetical protein [Ricinus communis]